jgi:hypothetical protein
MAATGILAAAYSSVTTALTDAGLVVVTDPRNARPMSVFVELPIGDAFNNNIVDVRISLTRTLLTTCSVRLTPSTN